MVRSEQYAWMYRRRVAGGRCLILNRHKGIWALWSLNWETKFQLKVAGKLEVVSTPDFSGTSHEALVTAISQIR